jgi:hypothetical protein
VRWPVADGIANGAMKPGVATSIRLSVDHIAIWIRVEPGEIGRLSAGRENSSMLMSPSFRENYSYGNGT